MEINDYLELLPIKRILSEIKLIILTRLWGNDRDEFPKLWVSSAELLELTREKYFDRFRYKQSTQPKHVQQESAIKQLFIAFCSRNPKKPI
jgi:hypothetical protein